jgi:glycosyltransferase involved in cell wall biosynthesis
VFVSGYVKDHFNNSPVNASVIYPGSDLAHFSCPENHSFPGNAIGMVYRLDTDKLNAEAIEVFITVARMKPGVRCYIIGDGFYLDYYKKRVKEEGLDNDFIFTGFVSYEELPGYYKKICLVIAPVHDESFGQVTPFAMSMGLPVVGYATGALEEILGSKRTLVEYGDKDALAALAVEMINDPGRREQAGRENKERVHQYFSVEKMISEYEHLYNSIL